MRDIVRDILNYTLAGVIICLVIVAFGGGVSPAASHALINDSYHHKED